MDQPRTEEEQGTCDRLACRSWPSESEDVQGQTHTEGGDEGGEEDEQKKRNATHVRRPWRCAHRPKTNLMTFATTKTTAPMTRR